MDAGIVLCIILAILVLGGICHWAFIAPDRAKRKRIQALGPKRTF